MKGIFDTKSNSRYDDEITWRYHFSGEKYLKRAVAMIGDWIVYREPQRERGRRAYVAAAQVHDVIADPRRAGHHYALVRDFLPFDRPVPFWSPAGYREKWLRDIGDRNAIGRTVQGESIRELADADFAAIVRDGLTSTLNPANFRRLDLEPSSLDVETVSLLQASEETQQRRIEQILLNRKIREANFRNLVCDAYDNRCAVTGLRIINGGGRAEVQAAHIRPVANDGPDIVQNGIALCGTAHWLFDRHLISVTNEFRLLVSHNKVPSELRGLFASQLERIHLPTDPALRPGKVFLDYHLERFASV